MELSWVTQICILHIKVVQEHSPCPYLTSVMRVGTPCHDSPLEWQGNGHVPPLLSLLCASFARMNGASSFCSQLNNYNFSCY